MSLKNPKKQAHNLPQVGDVVLIKENLPRKRWKIGIVHELIKGKDQMVRSAKVFMSPNKYLHRALSLLYPIECPESKNIQFDHSETKDQNRPFCGDNNRDNVNIVSNDNDEEDDLSDNIDDDVDKHETNEHPNDNSSKPIRKDGDSPLMMRHPLRQATAAARKKIKEWLNPSDNFVCVGSVAISIANVIM